MLPSSRDGLLALTALALTAFVFCWSPIQLDDHWWHMLTGRYLLETGAVPTTDPFSYTAYGQPWVNWEWLAGLAMFLAYDRVGPWGLIALRWTAIAGTLVALWFHLLRREAGDRPAVLPLRLLLCGLVMLVIFGRASDRPHLYAMPLLAAVHGLAFRNRPPELRHSYVLVGLMIPWVLVHPSWVLGVAVALSISIVQKTTVVHRLAPLAMTIPALVLHDLGRYAGTTAGLFGTRELAEWQPTWIYLHWTNTPLVAFILVSLLLIAALALAPERLKAPETWLVIALFIGSIAFVRFTPLFAIVAAPTIHAALCDKALHVPERAARLGAVLVGLLLLLVTLQTKSVFQRPHDAAVDAEQNPVSVAAFIERHRIGGNVWCNRLNAHAYLAFARYPEVHGYIDGRIPQLFDESAWLAYRSTTQHPDRLSDMLDTTNTQLVVVQSPFEPGPLALTAAMTRRRDFALVHFDENTMLWIARDHLAALATPPPTYELVVPPLIGEMWFEDALAPASFSDVLSELTHLREAQPQSPIGDALIRTLLSHPRATPEQRAALARLLR